MNEEPKVIHVRAGANANEQAELVGLIQRIIRESISTDKQNFILQLAYNQKVLNNLPAWKMLKQVISKQGLAIVVAGGSDEARNFASEMGFPLVGIAETEVNILPDLETIKMQVLGYQLPEELGELYFDGVADDYRAHTPQSLDRTLGNFIGFVRKNYPQNGLKP